ncbi:TetR/AcrR family transcriptional regulator C-terminal domain-containing protein [Nonomuraea sp. SBT364]|uniref:TetR/AcrR family transcriptional regulator C-terminal domain-containing protein n=1 Tax=Nonomuraea sp. SBT364 TaxID=1580530 RepID=UPI00066EAA64|nr:TetR/AcrR family transcriptional regulator C-terminal domain-containing protein [Nonomuraea sp. SBT364]
MPPYQAIAGELRRRIREGELAAGDRVPSTREITREWGVAMATASKVLATLREEGLVRAVPGVGTVVADAVRARRPGQELTRQRVVRTAMRVADAEGLAAVSMRRVAGEMGTSAMALYRHVRDKDELVCLMADAAYAEEPLPEPPPRGWRARIETSLRLQWRICRRHPWAVQATPLTRPQFVPHAMAHTEWLLRAVDGLGLDANTMLHVSVCLAGFVRGAAAGLEAEIQERAETGLTDDAWLRGQEREFATALASGVYPTLGRVVTQPGLDLDLDTIFEFGLRNHLDGLAVLVGRAAGRD